MLSLVEAWALNTVFVMTRISVFLSVLPFLQLFRVPPRVMLLLSLALSVFFSSTTLNVAEYQSVDGAFILSTLIKEAITGFSLGIGLLFAFTAFFIAGRLMDLQMGLNVAGLIDPSTNSQAPLMGTLWRLLGVTIFILEGGINLTIKALDQSFNVYQVGELALPTANALITQSAMMFYLGIILIGPVMITLLLVDLIMAFAGKLLPQMNVFVFSIPLKVFVGLFTLAITLASARPALDRIFSSGFIYIGELLG